MSIGRSIGGNRDGAALETWLRRDAAQNVRKPNTTLPSYCRKIWLTLRPDRLNIKLAVVTPFRRRW